jgi:hypothetical protein
MKIELQEKYKVLTSKQVYVNGKKIISLTIQNKSRTKILHA